MLTLYNHCTDPFYNQALEEYLFTHVTEDDLFYLWRNQPVVVVGRYQNICREVSVPLLRRKKIPVVRRISGGGTVYHDLGNINYTYMLSPHGLVDYAACLEPVVTALQDMGLAASQSGICDIVIGKKKISGSAQRSAKGRLLHHGTLLFQTELDQLQEITMQHKNPYFKTKGTLSAVCAVTNIREYLQPPMCIAEFQQALLTRIVGENAQPLTLTATQQEEVLRLRQEKYQSWEWTWGKTPDFAYEREGVFLGQPIAISYGVHKGIFSHIKVQSMALDAKMAEAALLGSCFDPGKLEQVCQTLAGEHASELLSFLL